MKCNPLQVSYSSIKAETGWTPPEVFLRRRRVIVKNPAIDLPTTSGSSAEKSLSLEQPPSSGKSLSLEQPPSSGQDLLHSGTTLLGNRESVHREIGVTYDNDDRKNLTSQLNRNDVSGSERKAEEVRSPVKSPVTVYVYPEPRRNSAPAMPHAIPDPNHLAQPLRQSTVETVDSGIADDQNGGGGGLGSPGVIVSSCPGGGLRSPGVIVSSSPRLSLDSRIIPTRPQPRFINGHRVVTRYGPQPHFHFLLLKICTFEIH